MDCKTARAAIEARLGRCLGFFEPSDRTQIAAAPEEVRALLDSNCPPEFEDLKKGLSERTPTHVVLSVMQAQQLIAITAEAEKKSGKEKSDAK